MAQRWRCSTSCIVHHVTSIRSVKHYFCSSLALAQHFCLTWFLQAHSCAVHTGNVNISKMLTFLCTTGVQECIPSNFIKNIKVNVKQLLMKKNLSRQFSLLFCFHFVNRYTQYYGGNRWILSRMNKWPFDKMYIYFGKLIAHEPSTLENSELIIGKKEKLQNRIPFRFSWSERYACLHLPVGKL